MLAQNAWQVLDLGLGVAVSPIIPRIGCLIEKEITTPEHYPLSLNALTNGCNQKRNWLDRLETEVAELKRRLDTAVR